LWIIFFVFFCCGITHAWGFVALLGNDNTEAKGMFLFFLSCYSNVKQKVKLLIDAATMGVCLQKYGGLG